MTETMDRTAPREALRKLAAFRNGLGSRERLLIDAILLGAFGGEPADAVGETAALPTEREARALGEKIKAFERTLPSEERQLVDEILARGSGRAGEAEVEPHLTWLWDQYSDAALFPSFETACLTSGGVWAQAVPAPLWYWPTRAKFSCWAW